MSCQGCHSKDNSPIESRLRLIGEYQKIKLFQSSEVELGIFHVSFLLKTGERIMIIFNWDVPSSTLPDYSKIEWIIGNLSDDFFYVKIIKSLE
jgi:hypothetical protein